MRSKDTEINAAADNAYGLPVGGREAWADRFAGDPLLAALDFSTGVVRIDRARVPAGLLDNPIAAALLANYFRISENDWGKAGAVSVVGPELDGLADRPEPANWNILWHLNMAAMQAIAPRRRLAALLMARDEALHLSEWFAHAAAIGIEHVFVYTNDNSDGTDQLLDWFSHQGHATVIRMSIARGVNIQKKNYEHALHLLPELRRYEWVAVLDADEFLVPAESYGYNLQRLLAAAEACFPSGPPAAILFPWFVRLWDCRYEYQPGLLAELYPHAIPFDLFKSVVRLAEVLSLVQVHVPTVRSQAFLVDSAFEKVPSDAVWTQSPKSFVGGRVEHFWGRSFEEFVIKKRRGDDLDVQMREYETFFAWAREATTENFAPMPTALIDRMRRNLATYEASGEYRGIMLKIDAWNRSHSERLRTDVELQSLYDKLYSRFRPSPDGSSARS